jgi:hypothetical protein
MEKKKKVCRGERKAGRRRERVAVAAWWPVGEEFKQLLVVETVMKRRW